MEFTINTIGFVFIILGCIVAGLIGGYFLARYLFTKTMKENPPISRDMIKAMYRSMGKTPKESDVNRTMMAIEKASKNPKK